MGSFSWFSHIHYVVIISLVLKHLPRLFNGYRFYANLLVTLLAGTALFAVYVAVDRIWYLGWYYLAPPLHLSHDAGLVAGFAMLALAGAAFIKTASRVVPGTVPAISLKNAFLVGCVLALSVLFCDALRLAVIDMTEGDAQQPPQQTETVEIHDR